MKNKGSFSYFKHISIQVTWVPKHLEKNKYCIKNVKEKYILQ